MGERSLPFEYQVRGPNRSTDPRASRTSLDTDQRDRQLEQYLHTPFGHTALVRNEAGHTATGGRAMPFPVKEFDPEQMWASGTNTRLTVPVAGIWCLTFSLEVAQPAGALGNATATFTKNGAGFAGVGISAHVKITALVTSHTLNATSRFYLAAGDYSEVTLFTTHSMTFFGRFEAEFVSRVKASGPTTP